MVNPKRDNTSVNLKTNEIQNIVENATTKETQEHKTMLLNLPARHDRYVDNISAQYI